MTRYIFLNFKNYRESIGNKAFKLVSKLEKAKFNDYELIIIPTLLSANTILNQTKYPVFLPHCDPIVSGAHTGYINVDEIKDLGFKGVMLNHSEHKLKYDDLECVVKLLHSQKIATLICVSTISEIKKVAKLKPTFIAYEPKALIGKEISVTTSKPQIILKAKETINTYSPKTKLIVGAGIHSAEDIGQAFMLNTNGVLIGHAVPKSKNPKKMLESLLID